MTQVKFYRVETLPEVGEVGSLYFVYGSGGVQSLLYICVGTGLFELYTPDLYELENKINSLEVKMEEESQTIQHKIDNIKLPEIDTTELAKEATLEEVKAEVQKVSSLDADIIQGKIKIAAAITQKGVPTTKSDSLNNMATKINQIRQTNNTGTSDWDELSFPEEYSYNAYRFAKDLMETELPAKYPSYLKDYLVGYGANSFWVGEYRAFTGSLVLSMADAYYTSDGHFYTLINGLVTHTLPDGTIETYESEVVEHKLVWNGSSNILVAHIYTGNYSVVNYQNERLLGVIACGTCLGFSLQTSVYYITSLGEINNVSLVGNGAGKDRLIIRNLKYLSTPLLNYVSNKTNTYNLVILPELEELNACIYNHNAGGIGSTICILPSLKINNSYINSTTSNNHIAIQLYYFSAGIKKLYKSLFYSGGSGGDHIKTLKEIHLPNLEDMNGFSINRGANGYFAKDSLEKLYMPSLKKASNTIFHERAGAYYGQYSVKTSLIDIEVGEVETNLKLDFWTAYNVLSDPEKTIQLQNNIHNHIAERVKDVTGEAPLTITFSQGVRDVLLPETEALFAAKNWNIAPAKSV